MRENCLTRYMNQVVSFGGLPMRRGDVIAELQAEGHPQRCIDMVILGMDRESALWENRR